MNRNIANPPPVTEQEDERAALIDYFENLEPHTETIRVLKQRRLDALKNGQEIYAYDRIQRLLGRDDEAVSDE